MSLLKNGIQTSGNIFKQSHHFETEIQNLLRNEITRYRDKFSKSNEDFLKNWPERYNLSGWLISMNRGGELAAHLHDTGWITGSVYINIPKRTHKHDGNLVVATSEHHDIESNLDECRSIAVETGTLCLFPSSLLHYTVPFESEEKRIVLVFDLIPYEV